MARACTEPDRDRVASHRCVVVAVYNEACVASPAYFGRLRGLSYSIPSRVVHGSRSSCDLRAVHQNAGYQTLASPTRRRRDEAHQFSPSRCTTMHKPVYCWLAKTQMNASLATTGKYRVRGLVRSIEKAKEALGEDTGLEIELQQGDISDEKSLAEAMKASENRCSHTTASSWLSDTGRGCNRCTIGGNGRPPTTSKLSTTLCVWQMTRIKGGDSVPSSTWVTLSLAQGVSIRSYSRRTARHVFVFVLLFCLQ